MQSRPRQLIILLSACCATALFFSSTAQAAKEPKRGPISDISLEINVPDNLPDNLKKDSIQLAIDTVLRDELSKKDYTFGGIQGTLTINLLSFRKEEKKNTSADNKTTTTLDLYSANIGARLGDNTGKVIWSETMQYPKSSFLNQLVRTFDPDQPEEVVQKAVRAAIKSLIYASTAPVPKPAAGAPAPSTTTAPKTAPATAPDKPAQTAKTPPPAGALTDETGQKYDKALKLNAWMATAGYYLTGKIPAESPVGTLTLTTNPPYSPGAILNSPTLKNYAKQKMAFMLDGYVNIKKSGPHVIIAELYNLNTTRNMIAYFCMYVDGEYKTKSEGSIQAGGNIALVAGANLTTGMHRIQIPFDPNNGSTYVGLDYTDAAMRIRLKGPDDDEAVELKTGDFYYPAKK